jgi:DNA-binding CsgD family transcriptional regulator
VFGVSALSLATRELQVVLDTVCVEDDHEGVAVILDAVAALVRCDVVFWSAFRRPPNFAELALVNARDLRATWRAPEREWLDHLDEHPIMSGRHGPVVAISDVLDEPTFARTWLYNEAFRPAGLRHEIGLELAHPADSMSVITLSREKGPDFGPDDHLALRRLNRPPVRLTRREHEVLALVRDGLTDAQVGTRLGIAESTVGKHLEHVYARTGACSRVQVLSMCADALDAGPPA